MIKKSKLVCKMGINDSDYVTMKEVVTTDENGKKKRKVVWKCPFYERWAAMLKRCYSEKLQKRCPTYKGCSVCQEWLTFSNFKAWMEKQDWEGKHLDKDILYQGNKIYSPETCVFVDQKVNVFLVESNTSNGAYMIGVHLKKTTNKFAAMCNINGKQKHLGYFNTELEAHKAWLHCKFIQARILAAEQADPRVAKALVERYENYK